MARAQRACRLQNRCGRPELKPKVDEAAKLIADFKKSFKPTLIARDLPKPRQTKLLERGEYNRPQGEPLRAALCAGARDTNPAKCGKRRGAAAHLCDLDGVTGMTEGKSDNCATGTYTVAWTHMRHN